MSPLWAKTIYGEPASKANSRRLVNLPTKTGGRRPGFIKSKKALSYLDVFKMQCPILTPLIVVDIELRLTIHYSSRRPDLDESLIMDALQGRVIANDRQIKRKVIDWGLDRERPRTDIALYPLPQSHSSGDQGRAQRKPKAKA